MNIDNKFLLVCLQLIIVVLMSMNAEGMPDVSSLIESSPDRFTPRAFRLYNNCAKKDIVIQDRISTTDDQTDDKAIVILETAMMDMGEGKLRIRIRGNSTGKYLCFNNKGKLVARPKILLQKKGRREKCEFYEISGRHGWSFQSVKNHDWYVGFNPKGSPKNGAADRTKHEMCFSFIKTPQEDGFDPKDHNSKIGTVGQTIPGFNNQKLLDNLQLNSVIQPVHRHRHENSRLSSRASHNMRSTKKSHRNRKSFSRTKTER